MSQLATIPRTDVRSRTKPDGLSEVSTDDRPIGVAAARRLMREMDSLEQLLRRAEQTAASCEHSDRSPGFGEYLDIDSRLEELERRERLSQEQERALERQQMTLQLCQEKLRRDKESLARAIGKFHADAQKRSDGLNDRSSRLTKEWNELLQARRHLARDQMRLKLKARDQGENRPSR